ncbi:MAG: hypothetical protein QXO20_07575 [Candidatus Bathyarchaeia archaeon]
MEAREALLRIKDVIEHYGDEKVKHSFYLEFNRRLLVLRLIEEYNRKGGVIIDLGAQPFIVSCALKLMGYEVIAYDYNPGPYQSLAEMFGVKVHKCDLERDSLGIVDESVDCAVLSEVIEHLSHHYLDE